MNYQYSAQDVLDRKEEWIAALPGFAKPYHYAAVSLAVMPGIGYGEGKAISEMIGDFVTHAHLSKSEGDALEAICSLRLLRKDGLKIFQKPLPVCAWRAALWLYLQLFLDSRRRKRGI